MRGRAAIRDLLITPTHNPPAATLQRQPPSPTTLRDGFSEGDLSRSTSTVLKPVRYGAEKSAETNVNRDNQPTHKILHKAE